MSNPLLGNRISLISKKNIRYEGTLYSINEQDATVALQNVRSYGTEGRESAQPVAPQDVVHPYLLFRGCDIQDLHVHETASGPPDDPAIVAETTTTTVPPPPPPTATETQRPKPPARNNNNNNNNSNNNTGSQPPAATSNQRRPRKPPAAIGTGASLLNRKARGTVKDVDGGPEAPEGDFDFQSKLKEFPGEDNDEDDEDDDDAGDMPVAEGSAYEKDDFFDSISCDALDKRQGVDNRLRGAAERSLNTETFGAVALNSQRRRRRGGGGGGGRGGGRGRGGRGGGRGRGRGRGRGYRSNNSNRGNSTPEWYTAPARNSGGGGSKPVSTSS